MQPMSDRPGDRLLYISLIGVAAIVPLLVNRDYGGLFSLVGVLCAALFIRSDRMRRHARRGFTPIQKTDRDLPARADESGSD